MDRKPRILIVNDDGIHAPGLKHLWQAVKEIGDVSIIAPATEKSGVGLSITIYSPLHIEQIAWEENTPAWKVTGTPADCVRLGTSVILDEKPDLIVSGINKGSNSGRTALFSGTVGGVIEGSLRNIPGVAFSCESFDNPDYGITQPHIRKIVTHLLDHPMPKGTVLNVNFPNHSEFKGFKLARQGKGYWIESPDARKHPDGYTYYWLGGEWGHHDEEAESDVFLLSEGYITAVPIHVDELTDHHFLKTQKQHFEGLFSS
jgi:5'-nucleotidase